MEGYELKALLFGEKYGIIDYYIFDNQMVYEMYYRNEGRFLHLVNLDSMEETVQKVEKAEWEKMK